jgi:hypothetical protein
MPVRNAAGAALARGDAVFVAAERVADLYLESGGTELDDDVEIARELGRERYQPDRRQRMQFVDLPDRRGPREVGLRAELARIDVRAFEMHPEHACRTGSATRTGGGQGPQRCLHLGQRRGHRRRQQ